MLKSECHVTSQTRLRTECELNLCDPFSRCSAGILSSCASNKFFRVSADKFSRINVASANWRSQRING